MRHHGDTFELALVGAGRMGRTHLAALEACPSVRVSYIVEPRPELRDQMGSSSRRVYPAVADLLAEVTPDGVLIAAPTSQHARIIQVAAAAGVPILCEKPAGFTAAEATAAARVATAAGVPFQVAYWRRYMPELRRLRERIQSGQLGDILLITASQWDERPPHDAFRAASGGIFVDMGVHEFDQVRWLTGQEVAEVATAATTPATTGDAVSDADGALATLLLSGGALCQVSLGRYFPSGDLVEVEVFGTRGHERVALIAPGDGGAPFMSALAQQAEAFAGFVRTGQATGASAGDAVAALAAAGQAAAHARCIPAREYARKQAI
jgi:myo-inositol 2-dehydrogenase / D-chiro-inositol 1-dehydrogenase